MKRIKEDTVIKREGCGTVLAVRHFPDRKKAALTVEQGEYATVVAYFTGDASEVTFLHALNALSGGMEENDGSKPIN